MRLAVFIFYVLLQSLVKAECPTGWIHFDNACYFFSREALNWYLAEFSCRAHDARLVEVQSKELSDFLINTAKLVNRSNYWMGGRDHVVDGKWQWASTDSDFIFTAWSPGEPNGGSNEDCLDMRPIFDYLWNDESCSLAEQYICEKKYPGSESEIVG